MSFIEVSKNYLEFTENEPFTHLIEVTIPGVAKIPGITGTLVQMKHNLPPCFDVLSPATFTTPKTVYVCYNPNSFPVVMPTESLELVFSRKMEDVLSQTVYVLITVLKAEKKTQESETQISSNLNELLSCQICTQKFTEDDENLIPRILTRCGHTACHKCYLTLHDGTKLGAVTCPYDRKESHGQVENFPKNFAIIDLLREMKQKPPVVCARPCVPCFENETHEASCYCTTCKNDYCESCFQSVHFSKTFNSHKGVPLIEKPIEMPKCQIHPEKYVLYMCKERSCPIESKLFCDNCYQIDHRGHRHIKYFYTISDNQRRLVQHVRDLKKKETEEIPSAIKKAQQFQSSFDVNERCVQDQMRSINNHYDTQKRIALRKFDNFRDSEQKKIQKYIDSLEVKKKTMNVTRETIEGILKKKEDLLTAVNLIDQGPVISNLEFDGKFLAFSDFKIPVHMMTYPRPLDEGPEAKRNRTNPTNPFNSN